MKITYNVQGLYKPTPHRKIKEWKDWLKDLSLEHARDYVKRFRADPNYNNFISDIRIVQVTYEVIE